MNINGIHFYSLEFPGRAGQLQRAGAVPALIRELGDNYATYNRFLAERLRELGGEPEPDEYRGDMGGLLVRGSQLRDVVAAELLLRRCEAHRKRARALDAQPARPPLVDPGQRLISIETEQPTLDDAPTRRARGWRPAPPPDVAPR